MILLSTDLENSDEWLRAFLRVDNSLQFVVLEGDDEVGDIDLSKIEYVVTAKPRAGILERLPNLRAIFSLWAGVESSVRVDGFPLHVPFYRMVDDGMAAGIAEYIIGRIFVEHVSIGRFMEQQRDIIWDDSFRPILADEISVGVMGVGAIGSVVLRKLSSLGFRCRGWSRSFKDISGVESFVGRDDLPKFLSACDYLVSLLPLTLETEDIFSSELFGLCKRGCYFINVGRGEQVIDSDLISNVDSGQLSGACLDVFREEPLPNLDPYWVHPRIMVTPHIAGMTPRLSGVRHIIGLMDKLTRGEPCEIGLYNFQKGY